MIALLAALVAGGIGYTIGHRRAGRGYRQIAALLLGLRDGDYALRAAPARGARGEAFAAVNALADELIGNRRAGIESDALLGKLLGAVDLAIIVIGPRGTIVGGNQAAGTLLGVDPEQLGGMNPARLGIAAWLDIREPGRFETDLPGGTGPWDVRCVRFRRGGRDHSMLVASDLSRALRAEERRVWRGLIRVLSHETGNSLGPIQATAEALQRGLDPTDTRLTEGLALIERRTRSLAHFIRRYAELARLPAPVPEPVALAPLLRRVVALETRVPVVWPAGTDNPPIMADAAQLEQALINLLRNAADAASETGGAVDIRLTDQGASVTIDIADEGPGLPRSENLFVPGFTTKPGGSGVGLVLAREIIEAHGGRLLLADRTDRSGVIARVTLPNHAG